MGWCKRMLLESSKYRSKVVFSKHLKTSQKKKVASYLDAEIKVAVRTNPKVSVSRSRKREGGKEGTRGKDKRIVYVEERGKMSEPLIQTHCIFTTTTKTTNK
jgi:hypothetical protein